MSVRLFPIPMPRLLLITGMFGGINILPGFGNGDRNEMLDGPGQPPESAARYPGRSF